MRESDQTQHPKILSIETSGVHCGVALSIGARLASVLSHDVPAIHDRELATMTETLLNSHSLSVKDLDAVAVSEGPGSFTGLRIGIAFAKALCWDNAPRLIPVPTLLAQAMSASAAAALTDCDAILVCVLSQRDKYYAQIFDRDLQARSAIVSGSREDVLHACKIVHRPFVCGPAADDFPEFTSLPHFRSLSVQSIADLASALYAAERFSDAQVFVPHYVQDFQPKIQAKKLSPSA